jgi:hypothetical protein
MLKNGGVDLDQRGNVRATRMITSWRPIAGGVGDPRRPAVRAGDRSVSDGDDDAAAVSGPNPTIRISQCTTAHVALLLRPVQVPNRTEGAVLIVQMHNFMYIVIDSTT